MFSAQYTGSEILVITYFGTPRLRQITPFLSKFSRGSMPPDPLAKVSLHIVTGLHTLQLCNPLSFYKNILKNAGQIYTYLMKLKLNKRVRTNSNCKKTVLVKINALICLKKSSLSCWKKSAPAPDQKRNGLSLI